MALATQFAREREGNGWESRSICIMEEWSSRSILNSPGAFAAHQPDHSSA
jgi:hypothetical protein